MEVSEIVEVKLGQVIELDFENFLDTIAASAGYPLMMDIHYCITGYRSPETIILMVTGEVEDLECPACQHHFSDTAETTTIEDHGVCYSCHKEILNGERCGLCYETDHSFFNCVYAQEDDK